MSFEQQQEQYRRRHAEGRELSAEAKEKQDEELEKKMAAKERMEKMAQEVKSTKQRMRNIMINIQQVVAAVRAIRVQLGLDQNGEVPAVQKDKKILEGLKTKLSGLMARMGDLKLALKGEEIVRLRQMNPNINEEELMRKAEESVGKILSRFEN